MPCAFRLEREHYTFSSKIGCQFSVPEHELISVRGEKWCEFHLPADTPNKLGHKKTEWGEDEIKKFNDKVIRTIQAQTAENQLVDLSGVVFPGAITFSSNIASSGSLPESLFVGAVFLQNVSFYKLSFGHYALFHDVTFSQHVHFSRCHFKRDALFIRCKFEKSASFFHVTFKEWAEFSNAQFLQNADFNESSFSNHADFTNATFRGETSFRKAGFSANAEFEHVRFGKSVDFSSVTSRSSGVREDPPGEASDAFHKANFFGASFYDVDFNNRQFLDTTNFQKSIFHRAPKFHNATLHQDTDFTDAKFLDTKSEFSTRAYRTLRLAMEDVRAHDEEAVFYALELRSRRQRSDTQLSVKAFSYLYEIGSDYGRSISLPSLWLLAAISFYWIIYSFIQMDSSALISCLKYDICPSDVIGKRAFDSFRTTFPFTIKQILLPFFVWREGTIHPLFITSSPNLIRLIATTQSLLSLGLLTLLFLAIRRRFRMN